MNWAALWQQNEQRQAQAEWSAALQSLLPEKHSARKCCGLNEAAPILVTKNDQRGGFNDRRV
jgi:hypothetical protein